MGVDIYIVGFHTEDTHTIYYGWEDILGRKSNPELVKNFLGELNAYGYLLQLTKELPPGSFRITQDQRELIYREGITTHKWQIQRKDNKLS